MLFEPFETPFSSIKTLRCRDLLWGERLVLDLFEYVQSGPAEDMEVPGGKESGVYPIGLTKSSRIWRLTFERPLAVRVRAESLKPYQRKKQEPPLPSRYCIVEKSLWLSELFPEQNIDPRLGELNPTHY